MSRNDLIELGFFHVQLINYQLSIIKNQLYKQLGTIISSADEDFCLLNYWCQYLSYISVCPKSYSTK